MTEHPTHPTQPAQLPEAPNDYTLPQPSAIEIHGLSKSFGDHSVLEGIDLAVTKGEVVAIIGPSGSGKSTLIRCMNLLEMPTKGRLYVPGVVDHTAGARLPAKSLSSLRSKVGMVFQSFNLFPTKTALENVSYAQVKALKRSSKDADARSRKLLEQVGLSEFTSRKPSQLSGGQQQRVAIARALALDPEIMLFDEPTSAIDPELRVEVLRVMKNLASTGMTMAIVTHEMNFARQVADRVIFLADGHIEEEGTPSEVLESPRSKRTQRFVAAIEGDLS